MHILFILLFYIFPLVFGSNKPLAPAIYVFGDSLFDSGNNNFLPTLAKADYHPYGANFDQGVTGRFTNGRTIPDFIAEFLHLPYAPPYLSTRDSPALTGLNYASGSCGILPESGTIYGKCLTLEEQIDSFEHTVKSELPKQFHSSNELLEYLSKSIFLFGPGTNDYLINYLLPEIFDTSKRYTPPQFAQLLTDILSQHFEKIYNLGARKVVMFEIIPVGCMPSLAKTREHTGQCYEEANEFVSYFNNRLPELLRNLTSTLHGSIFVLGRANQLEHDVALNPSKYGLADTINSCCPSLLKGTSICIPFLKPCPNPEKKYFWDGIHPTEALYSLVANRCINDATFCLPFNIKELTEK